MNGCKISGTYFPKCKVESHHLLLHHYRLLKTPGRSIDKKGFHQVELEIKKEGLEVEKIGFCVV